MAFRSYLRDNSIKCDVSDDDFKYILRNRFGFEKVKHRISGRNVQCFINVRFKDSVNIDDLQYQETEFLTDGHFKPSTQKVTPKTGLDRINEVYKNSPKGWNAGTDDQKRPEDAEKCGVSGHNETDDRVERTANQMEQAADRINKSEEPVNPDIQAANARIDSVVPTENAKINPFIDSETPKVNPFIDCEPSKVNPFKDIDSEEGEKNAIAN